MTKLISSSRRTTLSYETFSEKFTFKSYASKGFWGWYPFVIEWGVNIKPPSKTERYHPQKPFDAYLLKVNFSEKVSYDKVDLLDKLIIFAIRNFLREVHLQKLSIKRLLG